MIGKSLVSQARSSWQQTFNTCRLLIQNKQLQQLSGQAACVSSFRSFMVDKLEALSGY